MDTIKIIQSICRCRQSKQKTKNHSSVNGLRNTHVTHLKVNYNANGHKERIPQSTSQDSSHNNSSDWINGDKDENGLKWSKIIHHIISLDVFSQLWHKEKCWIALNVIVLIYTIQWCICINKFFFDECFATLVETLYFCNICYLPACFCTFLQEFCNATGFIWIPLKLLYNQHNLFLKGYVYQSVAGMLSTFVIASSLKQVTLWKLRLIRLRS